MLIDVICLLMDGRNYPPPPFFVPAPSSLPSVHHLPNQPIASPASLYNPPTIPLQYAPTSFYPAQVRLIWVFLTASSISILLFPDKDFFPLLLFLLCLIRFPLIRLHVNKRRNLFDLVRSSRASQSLPKPKHLSK